MNQIVAGFLVIQLNNRSNNIRNIDNVDVNVFRAVCRFSHICFQVVTVQLNLSFFDVVYYEVGWPVYGEDTAGITVENISSVRCYLTFSVEDVRICSYSS